MSEADFIIKLRDGATMIADACQERLEKLGPKETGASHAGDIAPDLGMIVWKPTAGPRGAFDIAESKANANNASFARLVEYLSGHEGKATVQGFFLWKFSDSSGSVGRKLKA